MRTPVIAALLVLAAAGRAEGQEVTDLTDTSSQTRWFVGPSLGIPGYGHETDPELFTVGVTITQVRPNHIGPDFAIGVLPRAFLAGAVALGMRPGIALPLEAAPGVFFIPSAGASMVMAGGEGGALALLGVNVGLATVLGNGPVGFRTGVTLHHFPQMRGALWLFEMGLVHIG